MKDPQAASGLWPPVAHDVREEKGPGSPGPAGGASAGVGPANGESAERGVASLDPADRRSAGSVLEGSGPAPRGTAQRQGTLSPPLAQAHPSLRGSPSPGDAGLSRRRSGDGSFSLWCAHTGEAFHSADGAVAEARRVFVQPAGLERFAAGSRLRVVEVAVGTGTNTAALIEAAADRGLELDWWGLELDPAPLRLALADAGFRDQWSADTLERLKDLAGSERLLWGNARVRVAELLRGRGADGAEVASRSGSVPSAPAAWPQAVVRGREPLEGCCDLVLLDAFSPQRCPCLWSLEFLDALARLLAPDGRLLTYCSAAAVRRALQLLGLQLAAIDTPPGAPDGRWSAGSVASPSPLPEAPPLRPLCRMEREHLASRAGEPYRDPGGSASTAEILAERQQRQARSSAEPAGAWQRRWGTARRHGHAG